VQLFQDVVQGDGRHGTELMIKYAREPPRFKNAECEETFKRNMAKLFEEVSHKTLADVDFGKFLGQVLNEMRTYRVKIEGNFATLALATIVLEGLGRRLDPNVKFVEAAIPFLWKNAIEVAYILKARKEKLESLTKKV